MRLAILGSGRGSNLLAVLEAIRLGTLDAEIALAVTDKPDSGFAQHARQAGLQLQELPGTPSWGQPQEQELLHLLDTAAVDVVVLAGWMRILKGEILSHYAGRMINLHPSLLPQFKGRNAIQQALAAGASVTGCSVHLVTEETDAGRILAQQSVPILPDDTEESLRQRIQQAEHQLLPDVLNRWKEWQLPRH